MKASLRDVARRLDVIGAWAGAMERGRRQEAFQRAPAFLRVLLPLMHRMSRYFDGEVRGLERVPAGGPVLLVGNHSGGVLTPDTVVFFAAWYRRFGLERALVGLAHDAAFGVPGFRTLMRKLGEAPANRENARRALDAGLAVLLYPGGDHEAFRPWRERHRVDFGGRKGFIEPALRTGVPVVPVVAHGGHSSLVILTRGEWIGRLFGVGRIRTRSFPLAWQIPWGLSSVGIPGIPLPAKITVEVCAPMRWGDLGPDAMHDLLGADMYGQWTAWAPPRPFAWAMRQYSRLHLADRHRPPVNVIVSCVPGPRERLRWSGGSLESLVSVGPIIEGAGLNVTAWSYADRLNVGVLSCPRQVPDPHGIGDRLAEELRLLGPRAGRARRPRGAAPARSRRTRRPRSARS
jgi:1-acyl-sn-glycerol-3-phosphate acyltransferase